MHYLGKCAASSTWSLLSPQVDFSSVSQEHGDRSRVSEAPSIRAEPRPAVARESPTLFFAPADLLCPHFQGFAKSPTTYL